MLKTSLPSLPISTMIFSAFVAAFISVAVLIPVSAFSQELLLSDCYQSYRAREKDPEFRDGLALGQSLSAMNGPGFPGIERMIKTSDSNAKRYERIAVEAEKAFSLIHPPMSPQETKQAAAAKTRKAQGEQLAAETWALKAFFAGPIAATLPRIEKLPRPGGKSPSDWMGTLYAQAYQRGGWFCTGAAKNIPLKNAEIQKQFQKFTQHLENRFAEMIETKRKLLKARTGSDELFHFKLESKTLFTEDEIYKTAYSAVDSKTDSMMDSPLPRNKNPDHGPGTGDPQPTEKSSSGSAAQ